VLTRTDSKYAFLTLHSTTSRGNAILLCCPSYWLKAGRVSNTSAFTWLFVFYCLFIKRTIETKGTKVLLSLKLLRALLGLILSAYHSSPHHRSPLDNLISTTLGETRLDDWSYGDAPRYYIFIVSSKAIPTSSTSYKSTQIVVQTIIVC